MGQEEERRSLNQAGFPSPRRSERMRRSLEGEEGWRKELGELGGRGDE